jgi:PPOX class probable F420-dependent enzyme
MAGGMRDRIRMEPDALARFLHEERTMTCATLGPKGLPHLMPLWYVVRDGPQLWAWTYAGSQKVRNLERDPRATLQVHAGERYEELRGAMLETDVTIHRDQDVVLALGLELHRRYRGQLDVATERAVRTQSRKRVALQFHTRRTVSWDHRMFSTRQGASS